MQRFQFVLLAGALSMMALVPVTSRAQTPSAQQPSVVATGTGEASAPVATATLQFLIGSGAAFGTGGMMTEAEPGTPAATGWAMVDPFTPLDEASFESVVEALIAAGVEEDGIDVTVPSSSSIFGIGGPPVGEIMVTLDQPEESLLLAAVAAAREAAPASGLSVLHAGAHFEPADCEALTQTAREAAIADAEVRATGLAEALGMSLGALIRADEVPFYGGAGDVSCNPAADSAFSGPFGPGTLAAFDPDSLEAEVYVQVTLTFALEGEA